MNKYITRISVLLLLIILPATVLTAQCKIDIKEFSSGEVLTYDLYFKYGIVNKKAGISTLTVHDSSYNGQDAYKMVLTAKSSGLAKSFFSMSDTLTSYMTKELVPLAYWKDAHEKDDHTIERATYSYSNGRTEVHEVNRKNGRLRYDTIHVSDGCMYDMLSVVYYARTLDFTDMKKGDVITIPFFSGRQKFNMDIEYHGIEKVSANDDFKYNCIKLVLMINDDAFDDRDEAMKVYLSDDVNRIPIRIDSKLKVGSTRAIIKSYQGLRY